MSELTQKMREGIADCRELVDMETALAYNREWAGSLEPCSLCSEQIRPEVEFFADAELNPDTGYWGILCPSCISCSGNKIVWGTGQLYQYLPDRQAWLTVAGFPPRHMWEE
jgi:hypothetical protein